MWHLTAKVQGLELVQSGKADTTAAEPVDFLRCTCTYSKGECTALSAELRATYWRADSAKAADQGRRT